MEMISEEVAYFSELSPSMQESVNDNIRYHYSDRVYEEFTGLYGGKVSDQDVFRIEQQDRFVVEVIVFGNDYDRTVYRNMSMLFDESKHRDEENPKSLFFRKKDDMFDKTNKQ